MGNTALNELYRQAVSYAEIYSEVGLKDMLDTSKERIKQKLQDKIEVAEGRKWNPLMKDGSLKELDSEIADLENQVKVCTAAIRIRTHMENSGHFDKIEIVADGMLLETD